MKGNNKGAIKTQYQFDKEDQSRIKIKEYFMAGQISSEAAMFTLRLLGFSITRTKEIVNQWIYDKSRAGYVGNSEERELPGLSVY